MVGAYLPGKLFSRLLEIYQRPVGSKNSSVVGLGKIVWKYLLRAPLVLRQTALLPSLSFLNKELFTVKTKTIFLWGEQNTTCSIRDYELIKSNFLNHRLVRMADVGHGWTTDPVLLGWYFEPLLARCFFKDE